MATNIDFVVDSSGKGILPNAGSVRGNVAPTLFRNDSYDFRIRVVDVSPQTNTFTDSILSNPAFKVGIGEIDAKPTSGEFKLTLSGPVTSGNIPYNATTTQVLNAVSGIAGNVAVTTFGIESNAWVIQAATANTALSFGGVANTLFPTSTVQISTRRNPATDIKAEQIVRLKRSPAIFSDSFTASSTAGVVTLTKTQDGATTANETYLLTIGGDAIGGSVVLGYGSSSQAVLLGTYDTGARIQTALNAITGLSQSTIQVGYAYGGNKFNISFVGALGNQNITTALTLDASGVEFAKYYSSTVTMATAELDAIFATTLSNTKTLTLEIETTDSTGVKTLGQRSVTVKRDLVSTGDAIPSPQASYYTRAETDAGFVPNSGTNVDSTNRVLHDSGGTDSVDWQNRKLYDGSTEYIAWNDGLGFYGGAAIAKPAGANVVSNIISLGLIASSPTYGVLPQSPRTLTAVTYATFGLVPSNNVISKTVTITGCQLNDIVLLGLPADIEEGLAFSGHVVNANQIHIDALNVTGSGKTQNATTFRITVIGY
jgi:cytoskeletal protein CcmA (bactofilin family)